MSLFLRPIFSDHLSKYEIKLDWSYLSSNLNPKAISFLEQNQYNIRWNMLSANPSAIHILKQNLDKI